MRRRGGTFQERPWSWVLGAHPAGPPSGWEVAVSLLPRIDPPQAGSAPPRSLPHPWGDGRVQMRRQGDGRQGLGGGAGGWLLGELPPREVLCASRAGVRKPPAEERASSCPPVGALSSELPGVVSRAPPAGASVHGEPAHVRLLQREPCVLAATSVPAGGPGDRSPARVPSPESWGGVD